MRYDQANNKEFTDLMEANEEIKKWRESIFHFISNIYGVGSPEARDLANNRLADEEIRKLISEASDRIWGAVINYTSGLGNAENRPIPDGKTQG